MQFMLFRNYKIRRRGKYATFYIYNVNKIPREKLQT